MPGNYDAENRNITLETDFQNEPELAVATLVNLLVQDFLVQHNFQFAHLPEAVDIAVVASGLGLPQSRLSMVNDTGSFWDPTAWEIAAKPFLDTQAIAYTFALSAWARDETTPAWILDLPNSIAGPTKRSLKFLLKTNDSFFSMEELKTDTSLKNLVDRAARPARQSHNSTTIIALKHFGPEASLLSKMETIVDASLRSGHRELSLHAINAATEIKTSAANVNDELKLLCESGDDLVRAKAIAAVGQLGKLDADTIPLAAKMLESKIDFVVFCGLTALTSQTSVDTAIINSADRGFKRALQTCNYQFVGLFAAAYQLWLEAPHGHFKDLLAEDSPEYLQIAITALDENKEQFVSLGS